MDGNPEQGARVCILCREFFWQGGLHVEAIAFLDPIHRGGFGPQGADGQTGRTGFLRYAAEEAEGGGRGTRPGGIVSPGTIPIQVKHIRVHAPAARPPYLTGRASFAMNPVPAEGAKRYAKLVRRREWRETGSVWQSGGPSGHCPCHL